MKRPPLTLMALFLLFAAPLIAAWAFFLNPEWLPQGRLNKGDLIDPVIPVTGLSVNRFGAGPLPLASLRGRWVLILAAEGCESACLSTLWDMRQVRLALGDGRDRVERLLLLRRTPSSTLRTIIAREYPGVQLAALDGELEMQLSNAREGELFLVDPLGNAMMRYPPGTSGKDLLTDMTRLLKASEKWGNYASR